MDDRASHILEVTIRLLADEGLGVPTARVARDAGIANGTLFNVFPTKQALFDGAYLRLKREVASAFEAMDTGGADLLTAMLPSWRAYVLWAIAAPQRHRALKLLKGGGAVSAAAIREGERGFGAIAGFVEEQMAANAMLPIGFEHFFRLAEVQADVVVAIALENGLASPDLDRLIERGFTVLLRGVLA